jgi:hypothetical protein
LRGAWLVCRWNGGGGVLWGLGFKAASKAERRDRRADRTGWSSCRTTDTRILELGGEGEGRLRVGAVAQEWRRPTRDRRSGSSFRILSAEEFDALDGVAGTGDGEGEGDGGADGFYVF